MILHFTNLNLTRYLGLVDGKPQPIQELYKSRLNSGFHLSKLCYPIFSSSVAIESADGSPFWSCLWMLRPVFCDSLLKAIVKCLNWYILHIALSCPVILGSSTGLSTEFDSVQNVAVGFSLTIIFERLGLFHNKPQQTESLLWSLMPHTGAASWWQTSCLWKIKSFCDTFDRRVQILFSTC